jgi:small subunit ribosomal protein S14
MAKTSMTERDKKRAYLIKKYAKKRTQIKNIINDPSSTIAERIEAGRKLQKLPRDSSPSRYRNRCSITGRSRGYYRKFGLGRIKARETAMRGEIPGLVKASW